MDYDRTISEMKCLSPQDRSGDYRRSENEQIHTQIFRYISEVIVKLLQLRFIGYNIE
jgi:hypothetical protein